MAITVMGLSVNDILSIKKRGIGADGFVSELYSAAAGEAGLVDTVNTTALYDPTGDTYGPGIVQTNKLYHSATEITTMKVNDLRIGSVATGSTIDVSFDDGSSWSTGKALNTDITDFTGTASDGGTYKLKLKFNTGAGYGEVGAYVWVTTGSLNLGREYPVGCGTTSDALNFGGETGAVIFNTTEIWSGSAWATTTAMPVVKAKSGGCGTIAAALCIGGSSGAVVSTTEKWSGSAWATTGAISQINYYMAACGTTAAALCFGGTTAGVVERVNTTEIWAGSTWATTTVLTGTKYTPGGCGTTAAALCFGGSTGNAINVTEKWAGSTWVTTTVLTVATSHWSGCGTTSDALAIGGNTGVNVNKTEIWNGSSWVTTTVLTETKMALGSCGITSAALAIGGSGSAQPTTERWLNSGLQKGFALKIN